MTIIGVITRGKYGHRLIETIKEHSDFSVVTADLPEFVPAFIEEPDEFLENLNFDRNVFSAEIVISYSLHPDLLQAMQACRERGRSNCSWTTFHGISSLP